MRVLYVNHTALVSGGERSLLTLLGGLPADVQPVVACPPGQLTELARALEVPVRQIPGTAGSLRFHPLSSSRAVVELGRSAFCVRAIARQERADLIHANTIRAALIATMTHWLGGPPVVAHVRDRLPAGAVSDLILRLIAHGAAAVIANSRYTAARLGSHRRRFRIVSNAVDLERFDPAALDGSAVRAELGIDPSAFVAAVIGQLTPWKGQDLAIRAVAELVATRPEIRLLIVGSTKFASASTRYDNVAFEAKLRELVAALGIEHIVRFLGEREDAPQLLAASDLLLAPSWEEPFGRSIIEAMAMGVPVIATEIGGPSEFIRHEVDGLLLPPTQIERWVAEMGALIGAPGRRSQIGARGRETALARFGVKSHVAEVLDVYAAASRSLTRGSTLA